MEQNQGNGILEEAANWHVHLHSGEATSDDRVAFERWLAKSHAHSQAYRRLDGFWRRFDDLDSAAAMTAISRALQAGAVRAKQIKRGAGGILSVVLATVIGWSGIQSEPVRYMLAEYRTDVGQQRIVELADHSRITLNTYSAFDIDFSGSQRRIILRQGEILVEVAKDPTRPFIVETVQGTARALGTQFTVKRAGDATDVAVIESVVEACAATGFSHRGESQCIRLHAGEGTKLMLDSLPTIKKVDVDSVAGWASGSLMVDDAPLADVLAEMERYRHGRIHYDPAELAKLRVSGVLPLNDTDRALTTLAQLLPIRINRYTPLLIVVRPR